MSNGQSGIGPATAAVAGFGMGLKSRQVEKMSEEQRLEHIKLITELRKSIEQLKMESIESYAQVAGIEARIMGDVTAAYIDATATGDIARSTVLAALAGEVNTRLKLYSDPEPELRNNLREDVDTLTTMATNIASGVGKTASRGELNEEELVDSVIQTLQSEDNIQSLAGMRNTLDFHTRDPNVGAMGRTRSSWTTREEAKNAIWKGIEAEATKLGLNVDITKDAFRDQAEEIYDLIGVELNEDDVEASKDLLAANTLEIEKLKDEMLKAGASVDNIDFYLEKVKTGTLEDLVKDGPSALFKGLKDETVAPETAKFIKQLTEELENDTLRMDSFERGIVNYNDIPGVIEARRALGLQDNYEFAFYVTNHSDQFNDAIKYVRNNTKGDLTDEQTAQLLGTYLAKGDEKKAENISDNPARMKRMLRRKKGGGVAVESSTPAPAGKGMEDLTDEKIDKLPNGYPKPKETGKTADDDEAAAAAAAEAAATASGAGVAARKAEGEKELKQELIDIAKESDAWQDGDELLTIDQLLNKFNMQVGGEIPVVTPDPVDQYLTPQELEDKLTKPTPETEETSPTPGDTPSGGAPPSGGVGGYDPESIKPKSTTLVDLNEASKGMLKGPMGFPRTGITSREGDVMRDLGLFGTTRPAINIYTRANLQGKNISMEQARRMSALLRKQAEDKKKRVDITDYDPDYY